MGSCVLREVKLQASTFILRKITGSMPEQPCDPTTWKHVRSLPLADPDYHLPNPIDVLLGAEVLAEILRPGLRRGPPGTPIAQASTLGWLLSGRIPCERRVASLFVNTAHCQLLAPVQRFRDLEELSVAKSLSDEETRCNDHFVSTHELGTDVRFENKQTLLDSIEKRHVEVGRLKQVEEKAETKLQMSDEHYEPEYKRLHHMDKPSCEDERSREPIFLAHNTRIKESSSTTHLRFGFKGSATYLRTIKPRELSYEDEGEYSGVASTILKDFSIDNRTSEAAAEHVALKLTPQLRISLEQEGFQMRKWSSNSSSMIAATTSLRDDNPTCFCDETDDRVNTLVLLWNILKFLSCLTSSYVEDQTTQRILLFTMFKVYDLSWSSQEISKLKTVFQCSCNEKLPVFLEEDWEKYSKIRQIDFLQSQGNLHSLSYMYNVPELNIFCEESKKANNAATYLRTSDENDNGEVTLIAQSRVAPIKPAVNLSHLELCGALVLPKCVESVDSVLHHPIPTIHAWIDSVILIVWISVLIWIRTRRITFVIKLTIQLQDRIPTEFWPHVQDTESLKDCVSHNISPCELKELAIWRKGAMWLNRSNIPETRHLSATKSEAARSSHGKLACDQSYASVLVL